MKPRNVALRTERWLIIRAKTQTERMAFIRGRSGYITYLQREAKLKFGKLSKTHKHVQLNSTNVFQTGFGLLADQSKNTFNKIAGKRHTSKTSSYRNQIRQTLLKAAAKHPTLRMMTEDHQLVI